MSQRISYAMVRERNEKFSKLCGLVCPDFLKKNQQVISEVARTLYDVHNVLDILCEQAQEFKGKYPKGIKIKDEIPIKTKSCSSEHVNQYKTRANKLIGKTTKMQIPLDINIPQSFYEEIIKYCIGKK